MLQTLGGPEFITQLVRAFKASLYDSTVGAEDGTIPVDNFGPDSASLQNKIQAINENGASSTSIATFDNVEITCML